MHSEIGETMHKYTIAAEEVVRLQNVLSETLNKIEKYEEDIEKMEYIINQCNDDIQRMAM